MSESWNTSRRSKSLVEAKHSRRIPLLLERLEPWELLRSVQRFKTLVTMPIAYVNLQLVKAACRVEMGARFLSEVVDGRLERGVIVGVIE